VSLVSFRTTFQLYSEAAILGFLIVFIYYRDEIVSLMP
jgi:hypothetical protein